MYTVHAAGVNALNAPAPGDLVRDLVNDDIGAGESRVGGDGREHG